MAAPETGAPRVRVPVGEVAAAAYRAVFGRLGLFLDLAWLPLLILLAVDLVPDFVQQYLRTTSPAPTPGPLDVEELAADGAALLCLNAFAVRWYRAGLFRGGDAAMPRRVFVATWARFLGYALVLYLPVTAAVAALRLWAKASAGDEAVPLAIAAATAVLGAASLAAARFSLVFPAAAQGSPIGFRAAWRRMRGNTWRLVGATLLVCLPILILVSVIVSGILGAADLRLDQLPQPEPLGLFLLSGVLDTVLNFVFLALGASIMVEFYRRIVRDAVDEGRGHR